MQDTLAELVACHVDRLRSLRGADPATIIAAATAAADAIEAAVEKAGVIKTSGAAPEAERAALLAAQRLLYNAAADCWPGWDDAAGRPSRTSEDLRGGVALARRSQGLVQRLDLGPVREGTAQWMVGAYHLALGEIDAALAAFALAVASYESAAAFGPAWLARGYIAIALEVAGRRGDESAAGLDEVLAALHADFFDDAAAFRNQLIVARRVFTRSSKTSI